ncbi:MAG: flagellar basal-body rod protein FlgG [Pseudomonadota bacterium]
MIRSLWTAATGMQAQTLNIDVIANNLANVSTTGFKKSRADFQDMIYQTLKEAGSASTADTETAVGIQIGHGTGPSSVSKSFIQGELQNTKRELDMAIEGLGFFQVTSQGGQASYTRNGAFHVDSEGRLVTAEGFAMEPEITIPTDATSISIGLDGTVSVLQPGQTEPAEVGTITMVRFPNPAGLKSMGRNLYEETRASGSPATGTAGEDGMGFIAQGYLEGSNVSVVDEMVKMIAAQRAYETNSKTIRTADEMLQMANQLKR